jgi:hypothetical protein
MVLGSTQPLVNMSTRNIHGGKGGRCVRLTTSPPSRAECHEFWEPKPPGTVWATPGLLRDDITFTFQLFLIIMDTAKTNVDCVMSMRTALFWVITQRGVVICYPIFGTTYRPHLQGSGIKKKKDLQKMGPIGCPETSVRNYHYPLRNNPEECSYHLLRGGTLKLSVMSS